MNVLHPDNKIAYTEGQSVEVCLNGDTTLVVTGRVIGKANNDDIIDYWIVMLDKRIAGYPWSAISVSHIFIRPAGDNRPFLCEGVSRV